MEINIKKGDFQDRFLFSQAKFPALICGVGTGKTLLGVTKVYDYCERYPGTTALIVRKEFTDLRDSTMIDWERYFECKIASDKNYRFGNGSMAMFRHAAELNMGNLKNLNAGIALIEQIEEFPDDNVFQFIRDRLRQENGADVRPLLTISNANGHNFVHKIWIAGAKTINVIDEETGQKEYLNGEYQCWTANSFANTRNLPDDFIKDLKRKEHDAPAHFRRYVMNSFEETEADDTLFSFSDLKACKEKAVVNPSYGYRVAGFDIARFGNDACAAVILEQMNNLHWEVVHVSEWRDKNLNYSTGKIVHLIKEWEVGKAAVDEDGIGSGVLDTLTFGQKRDNIVGFRNPTLSADKNPDFSNPRTAAAFRLKDLVVKEQICITDEVLIQELLTLRYEFENSGRRILVNKNKMRKEGIASPNRADALIYAVSLIDEVKENQDSQYQPRQPEYSSDDGWNPFKDCGIW